MVRTLQYFKDKFVTGYEITEDDMADWLDSFRHVSIGVPLSDTTGLDAILANYRLTSVNVPVGEVAGLSDYIASITVTFLTSASAIEMSQITGLVDAISGYVDVGDVQLMINDGGFLNDAAVQQKIDDAIATLPTPEDGTTPVIGENGNWYIAGEDTGVRAQHEAKTDYNHQITGVRNGANPTLGSSAAFRPGTLAVWRDGFRLSAGGSYDFVEGDNFQSAILTRPPTSENLFIFEYEPQ